MAKHIIRPIPLFKFKNWPWFHETYLLDFEAILGPLDIMMYVWYIEGPKKKIVVDSGCTVGVVGQSVTIVAPHSTAVHVQTLEEGLGKYGVKLDDIDMVIQTHMHPDHVETAKKFRNAEFIVQKAEHDFAFNPHPAGAALYVKDFYDTLKFRTIVGDQEIVDGVKVYSMPGHTAGSQAVAVDTAKGKAIITSMCTVNENFNPPEPLKSAGAELIVAGIHCGDTQQIYDNMARIKKMADIIVPLHEISFADKERIG